MLAVQKVQPGCHQDGDSEETRQSESRVTDKGSLLPIVPGLAGRGWGHQPATDSEQSAKRGSGWVMAAYCATGNTATLLVCGDVDVPSAIPVNVAISHTWYWA